MSVTTAKPAPADVRVDTYRAAVVHAFHEPLSVEHVPRRELEAGQVRVKVEACGLCHTDIHAAHGDWPVKPSPPFIPGHEGVGIVVELGPGVTEVALGDRVAMPWLGYACGTCDYCVSGWETLCLESAEHGLLDRRGIRRVRRRPRPLRRGRARGHGLVRRCAADVRRRYDLQGREGRRDQIIRPRRRVRRRRPRAPRDPVRLHRRRARGRGRSDRREARARA